MRPKDRRFWIAAGLAAAAVIVIAAPCFAQTGRNPFAVAGDEGSANPTGIGGWILAQQTMFDRMIAGAVRSAKTNGSAMWTLAGISFAYGVLRAAGPGHGKAVVASYMVANETALKRGLVISFLAAMLQGSWRSAVVTLAYLAAGATAPRIQQASRVIDILCYAAIALLGAWLLWRKGSAFVWALRHERAPHDSADLQPKTEVSNSWGAPVCEVHRASCAERTIEAQSTREEAVVSKDARVKEELVIKKDVDQRTETVTDKIRKTKVDVEDDRGRTAAAPAKPKI